MKVNMVLIGNGETLLEFMELAISEKVFHSFTVVEADIESEPEPVNPPTGVTTTGSRKRPVLHPRSTTCAFHVNDRVEVKYDLAAHSVKRGQKGRVVATRTAGRGWSCHVEFREPGVITPTLKWLPESKIRLLPIR